MSLDYLAIASETSLEIPALGRVPIEYVTVFVLLALIFFLTFFSKLMRALKKPSPSLPRKFESKSSLAKTSEMPESAPLGKTARQISAFFREMLPGKKTFSTENLEIIREILLRSDFGVQAASHLTSRVESAAKREGGLDLAQLTSYFRDEVIAITSIPMEKVKFSERKLEIILLVGVNGAGKTTTAAKIAAQGKDLGKKVLLVAADTFRAAAVEQLQTWASRIDCAFLSKGTGADPAAVAFEGVNKANQDSIDLVVVDTAGRLQNKKELMDELSKILRSVKKAGPDASVKTFIVVDGTTGQNALSQIEIFSQATPIDGIVVTKLDGTAKGGVVVAAAIKFGIPIVYVGLGEKINDLTFFDAKVFAEGIFPVPTHNHLTI